MKLLKQFQTYVAKNVDVNLRVSINIVLLLFLEDRLLYKLITVLDLLDSYELTVQFFGKREVIST